MLRDLGYEVQQAEDGEEALGLLERARHRPARPRPDVLLIDYAMPGMTGLALAAAARDARLRRTGGARHRLRRARRPTNPGSRPTPSCTSRSRWRNWRGCCRASRPAVASKLAGSTRSSEVAGPSQRMPRRGRAGRYTRRSERSSSRRASSSSPTASSAPSSPCGSRSRTSARPWPVSCSAATSPASRSARCAADGSSSGSGTSAPMPPSPAWSSPRPRPCRSWSERCPGWSLRAVVGFGCAGLFVTTESWLNAKAQPAERGRVFSIYMVGTFLALAVGQLLIGRARDRDGGAVQCDRRPVRRGAGHGEHDPGRAAPDQRRGDRCPMASSRARRPSRSSAAC